jgi:hypothetical protein
MSSNLKEEKVIVSKKAKDSSLLLLGLSQNGKSLLGNYLINGEASKKPFKIGGEGISETKDITSASVKATHTNYNDKGEEIGVTKYNITIVDTPGVSDSENRDLINLLRIIKELKAKSVGTVALIVNYERRFYDKSFTDNVMFYKQLFPDLFDKNLFILFTNVSIAKSKVQSREFQEVNLKEQLIKESDKLRQLFKISFVAHDFIESIPLEKEDVEHSASVRQFLLARCSIADQIQILFDKIPKLPAMIEFSKSEISRLEEKVIGYIDGSTKAHLKLKSVLNAKLNQWTRLQEATENKDRKIKQLEYQSSDELKLMSEIKFMDKEWKLGWQSAEYDFGKLPCVIRASPVITPNDCYKYDTFGGIGYNTERGKVSSCFLKGLFGTVMAYTYNKDWYALENKALQENINAELVDIGYRKQLYDINTQDESEQLKLITELKAYISETNEAILKFKQNYFTVGDLTIYKDLYPTLNIDDLIRGFY